MHRFSIVLAVTFGFASHLHSHPNNVPTLEDTLAVYSELFNTDDPIDLTLKFDVRHLKRTRRKSKYQPADMTCQVDESFQVTHPVRIKARGIYRRDNCSMPPFFVNIRKSGIEADSLEGVKRMKMVVRCRPASQYANLILREYLVYKLFSLISPYGFRVRLVNLKIVDTSKDDNVIEDWAFLIEPEEVMTKRLDGKMFDSDRLSIRTVNRECIDQVAMFQYMVGNGDWSVTGRHNLKIMALNSGDPAGFIPIPYDFDYAGLVDAPYSTPQEDLGIKSVTERYFLGNCRSEEVHARTIGDLAKYRDKMLNYIQNFEFLDEEEKADIIEYLTSYFEESQEDWFIARKIATTCR